MKPKLVPKLHTPANEFIGPPSRVDLARRRFGREFAHEPGSHYERNPEPVLTRWMRTRGNK